MRTLAMLVLVTAAGCPGLTAQPQNPTVAVSGVAVASVSLTGGVDGSMTLNVTNPNDVGLPLSAVDWQLAIAGTQAVTGHLDLSQTIPAHATVPVTASVHIDAMAAVQVAQKVSSGARDYHLDGQLHFTTALGPITVEVHQDGTLSAP